MAATGVWNVGEPQWSPVTTRYVQLESTTGPYYDRQTGFVLTKQSNGSFVQFPNQTSAQERYANTISGIKSAGPIGTPPQTAQEAATALQQGTFENGQFKVDNTTVNLNFKPTVDNNSSGALRYPEEMTIQDETDYVSFEFFKYNPPFGKGPQENRFDFSSVLETNAYNFYNSSGVRPKTEAKAKELKSKLSPIVLYMPEDIQSQYGANWGGAEFGTAAVGMMRTFGTETPAPNVAASALGGMGKAKFYDEVLKQINSFTNANIQLNQFMGAVSGTILNPNTEMLYQGTSMRTFSLSFKMTPKRNEEALVIKKICNTFKKAMLPKIGGQTIAGESVSLLSIPDVCQVTFMRGGSAHDYLPIYKLCAITGVDVNYTADGTYATYEGGSPVSTKLTVNFKEMKILFQNDINEEGLSH